MEKIYLQIEEKEVPGSFHSADLVCIEESLCSTVGVKKKLKLFLEFNRNLTLTSSLTVRGLENKG